MTTRADLIETAARAIRRANIDLGFIETDTDTDDIERTEAAAVVDAVLPQITTAEQLDALPLRTKVLAADGNTWEKYMARSWGKGPAWRSTKGGGAYNRSARSVAEYGPFTVVWQPSEADR
jgi:hypothetical protein